MTKFRDALVRGYELSVGSSQLHAPSTSETSSGTLEIQADALRSHSAGLILQHDQYVSQIQSQGQADDNLGKTSTIPSRDTRKPSVTQPPTMPEVDPYWAPGAIHGARADVFHEGSIGIDVGQIYHDDSADCWYDDTWSSSLQEKHLSSLTSGDGDLWNSTQGTFGRDNLDTGDQNSGGERR